MRLIDLIDKSVGDQDHLAYITTCLDVAMWSSLNEFVCGPHRLLIDLIDVS